ncbi:1-aminocyclopropane-1-carboxylate deaminase [Lasiodiplodia theobromae]|uniref:1-aminocyclopropane-1-carboxylate deaminase n=1 Tax=Lasiodiplodia theobromae TaxID=45133 RepID=UPI0015C3B690|nr:1-aminocyclopropane-1-carboxylate deaminase [Lasiodiplodia theobromae]KAF4540812.1 1-aminocyclopropane-1-carboxylate deaminase [Lasiodiplodia theobromae]
MSGGTLFAMALPPSLDPLNPLNPYKGFYGCGGGAAYAPPAPAPARAVPPSFALPRIITRTVKAPSTEQQHNNDDAEVEVGTEPTDAGGRGKSTRGRGGGARGQKSGGSSARGGGSKSGGRGGRTTRRGSRAQGGGDDDGDDDEDDGRKRGGRRAEPVIIVPPDEESTTDEDSDSDSDSDEEEEDEEEQGPPAKKAKKGKGRAVTFAADVMAKNNRPGGRYFGAIKHAKWTHDNHPPPPSRRPGMPPPVPAQERVAPWGETWVADQMASFDFGETIFAGAYQSAQITADLLGGATGKTPKVQPPESLPWKTRFDLPQPKDMPAMARRDAEFERAGVWKLTKENVPALFEKKGATLMSIFPQHSDCNSNKKLTASLV